MKIWRMSGDNGSLREYCFDSANQGGTAEKIDLGPCVQCAGWRIFCCSGDFSGIESPRIVLSIKTHKYSKEKKDGEGKEISRSNHLDG